MLISCSLLEGWTDRVTRGAILSSGSAGGALCSSACSEPASGSVSTLLTMSLRARRSFLHSCRQALRARLERGQHFSTVSLPNAAYLFLGLLLCICSWSASGRILSEHFSAVSHDKADVTCSEIVNTDRSFRIAKNSHCLLPARLGACSEMPAAFSIFVKLRTAFTFLARVD